MSIRSGTTDGDTGFLIQPLQEVGIAPSKREQGEFSIYAQKESVCPGWVVIWLGLTCKCFCNFIFKFY